MKCLSCSFIWWSAQSSKSSNSAVTGRGTVQVCPIQGWGSMNWSCAQVSLTPNREVQQLRGKEGQVSFQRFRSSIADSQQCKPTGMKPPQDGKSWNGPGLNIKWLDYPANHTSATSPQHCWHGPWGDEPSNAACYVVGAACVSSFPTCFDRHTRLCLFDW